MVALSLSDHFKMDDLANSAQRIKQDRDSRVVGYATQFEIS